MQKAVGRALGLAALALAAFDSAARAQDTVRVRGTIDRVDGPIYVVKARDGAELKISLAENGVVVAIVKASLADLKPGLLSGRLECHSLTEAKRRSKFTSSRRRCAVSVKDTMRGT